MTQAAYQNICMVTLRSNGWRTDKTDRRGLRNEAGWLSHYDPEFKERGTFCIPINLLQDPTCTLVCIGSDDGFFVVAKKHLRHQLGEKRASLSDSKEFLVVPVEVAAILSIAAFKIEVESNVEG